jgi:hypothetical protein
MKALELILLVPELLERRSWERRGQPRDARVSRNRRNTEGYSEKTGRGCHGFSGSLLEGTRRLCIQLSERCCALKSYAVTQAFDT